MTTPEEVGAVFGLRRRRSRAVLARAELGESFDHLRQAATYATGGVAAAFTPRAQTARAYVAPKAAKIRNTTAGGWGTTMALLVPVATVARQAGRISAVPGMGGGMSPRKMSSQNMSSKRLKRAMMAAPAMPGKMMPGKMMPTGGRRRWPMAGLLMVGAIAGTAGVLAMRRRRESEWEAYDPAADLDAVHPGGSAAAAGGQPASHRPAGTAASNGHSAGTAGRPTGTASVTPAGATGQAGTASRAGSTGQAGTTSQAGATSQTGSTGQVGTSGQSGTTSASGQAGTSGGNRPDGVLGSPAGPSASGRG